MKSKCNTGELSAQYCWISVARIIGCHNNQNELAYLGSLSYSSDRQTWSEPVGPIKGVHEMIRPSLLIAFVFSTGMMLAGSSIAQAQTKQSTSSEFGPVMRAYLGYLRNEQEVVDDRISRREISPAYYRRNSNRIRALRQMAIRIVSKSGNDYVPELEAVAGDELGILFENPPSLRALRVNELVRNTFRYMGNVSVGEVFYVFARLDPYEQAALMEGTGGNSPANQHTAPQANAKGQPVGQVTTRPRRTGPR